MYDGIDGKVALVTGAARRRGIGRATALMLARNGADVACLDIARPFTDFPGHQTASADELDEIVGEIGALGRRAVAIRADVANWDEVHAGIAEASEVLGPIQLVANVAGGAGFGMGAGPLMTIGEREFDQVLAINLKGTWIVCRAAAQRMIDAGLPGRIVNVSSQAGKRGFPMLGAYCAAKAGVILLTQVLAQELGRHGITVNAVCPGTVDTDLINKDRVFEAVIGATEPGGFGAWLQREIPLGRLQQPEEVASAITFLLSDGAAYITGEAVNVSGGQTMV
ncbi:MAG: SDR family oxidoreductase [Acidimicrobiales bacterium]|nr:SDR family oxidoreductase [Acidimicrobiales bacterium]